MQAQRELKNPYHPDVPLFLILIPFISGFNYYLTYPNIQFNGFLLLTFTIDTVQGYLAWYAVRQFIIYLDKKWPYYRGPLKRILFQALSTTLLGLAVISLLTELVSWIALGKPAPLIFYTRDLFIISIWFFVINGIYIGLHYYYELQDAENKRQEENRIKQEGFPVRFGKKELWLKFDEIPGFYVEGDYAVACHLAGNKYYLDQSLDKVEQQIPPAFFFRLNRQYILHRQFITGFKRAENGKLLVLLQKTELFPSEIPVSRIKAAAFKAWFRPE
ncbi:LytR/AlgR family response regulator transcription factor [Tellurirhabdus rosea]|uniref:LytR/AlgR family response regulator transcription factor n=1 Tax=Tellurirhabdus rosea TaxID=2674997 RepID=UPI00224FA549|nr:LytTR family DNA-binding domain-containing protein [Tellurirhabdus rosea]